MSTLNTSCIILPLGGARIKGFFVCFYYTVIPRFWLTMLCVVVSVCLQRYIWWKKNVDIWTKDHPFPIDIDYMISDTLELLRPKMTLCCSLEEATKQVADLEREMLVKLGIRPVVYTLCVIPVCVNCNIV